MKAFWKEHWKIVLAVGLFLLFAGGWFLIWNRVGNQVEQAAYRSV